MRVFVVRHAEAASGEPDESRELTPAGAESARALGKQLAANGVRPDAILTSPLLRARQTGAELARALGVDAQAEERLAPGATGDAVRKAVVGRGEIVVLVGHQPDCGRIVAELTGGEEPPFPPAGIVAVELPD
ncbi:MAG: phosphohistidine phosphatase SixA [Gaiellaceae bacterium]